MFLSKRANGVYYIYYTDEDGKRQGISTKTNIKHNALIFLTNFQNEVKKKSAKNIQPVFFNEFKDEFLLHSQANHTEKTTATYISTFKFFEGYIGNKKLSQITQKDIKAYIDKRIVSASVFQARKDLINLASSFNWAITQNYIQENPCNEIKKVRVPQKMPLFFSEDEFKKFIDVIDNQDIKDIIIFAVNTGLRQMELLTLEWTQINFTNRLLILDNRTHITKSKKIRTVPLNNTALSILNERQNNKFNSLVFNLNQDSLSVLKLQRRFRSAIKKADLNKKLNFHSLRHTFASWLVQRGVSIYEVSKLLGHSDLKMTQIYAHLSSDNLENAVNKL